jgi:hypothetical protein
MFARLQRVSTAAMETARRRKEHASFVWRDRVRDVKQRMITENLQREMVKAALDETDGTNSRTVRSFNAGHRAFLTSLRPDHPLGFMTPLEFVLEALRKTEGISSRARTDLIVSMTATSRRLSHPAANTPLLYAGYASILFTVYIFTQAFAELNDPNAASLFRAATSTLFSGELMFLHDMAFEFTPTGVELADPFGFLETRVASEGLYSYACVLEVDSMDPLPTPLIALLTFCHRGTSPRVAKAACDTVEALLHPARPSI